MVVETGLLLLRVVVARLPLGPHLLILHIVVTLPSLHLVIIALVVVVLRLVVSALVVGALARLLPTGLHVVVTAALATALHRVRVGLAVLLLIHLLELLLVFGL